MPKYAGRLLRVWVDDSAGTQREISGDVTSFSVPNAVDMHDVSGGNDARKSYVVGQIDVPLTLEGKFNDTANRAHAVLSGLLGGTTGYTVFLAPAGSATGLPRATGEVVLASYDVDAGIDGAVNFRASLRPADTTGVVWGSF